MNSSAISLISEQGVDIQMFMDQCDFMDPFDEEDYSTAPNYGQDDYASLLSSSSSTLVDTSPPILGQTHDHQIMPHNYSNFSTIHNNMGVINFANHNPSDHQHAQQINPVDQEVVVPQVNLKAPRKYNASSEDANMQARVQPTKKKRIRPPSQTYDHIMAERRRREQLSQQFVALSALIPGLKKMDKGSILEDAIKYTKELQERVKMLEKNSERKGIESVVIVKRSHFVDDDDDDEGSSNEQSRSSNEQSSSFEEHTTSLPEIEAKVNDNQILVKVLCEKQKDALAKLIRKVESLNLMVVSTNATSFGDITLDITIVAEMEKEFKLSVKEVVTALRAPIQPAA